MAFPTRSEFPRPSAVAPRNVVSIPAGTALLLLAGSIVLGRADKPFWFLDWVNLAFHEAGHLFLSPFGSTLHLLGGTLMQLFVPALLAAYFLVARSSPLGAALGAWWLGESLINVSVYMADARDMRLELVGGGEHDWTQIFYQFGLLGEGPVTTVSGWTHHLGVAVMLAATAWAAWLAFPLTLRRARDEQVGWPSERRR